MARLLGLTVRQVQHAEYRGLRKMRAGLTALGWTPEAIDAVLFPLERQPARRARVEGIDAS